MVYIIINGLLVEAETGARTEFTFKAKYHTSCASNERKDVKNLDKEDNTLTTIMREILNSLNETK